MKERWPETSAAKAAERLLLLAFVLLLGFRAVPGTGSRPEPPPSRLVFRVDLNSAPWFDLVNLPGIGATRAREIVRDRKRNGPFRRVEDLLRIRGIGPATVARVRGSVVGGGR